MTENLMKSPGEIKKAQTGWRRRRGAMQRNDWQYQLLLERCRDARARCSELDRQLGFYDFWNRQEEAAKSDDQLTAAWEAWRDASRDVDQYELHKLGEDPTA
jgi:hypothetical protein